MIIAIKIAIAVVLCFPWNGLGTRVFNFNEGSSAKDELSSASLTDVPSEPLPAHFAICSSHTQQLIDTPNTRTVYVLYEDSNFTRPWFSIGFYNQGQGRYKLFANTKFNFWYQLLWNVPREIFLDWIHICVDVDTVTSRLRTSLNGGNVTTVTDIQGLTPVPRLYLQLGVVAESYSYYGDLVPVQFIGAVGNVNIYKSVEGGDQDPLTFSDPCNVSSVEKSMYLAWSNTKWNVVGDSVEVKQVENEMLCSKAEVLNFRIPLLWNKDQGTEECSKYGKAMISNPPFSMMNNVPKIDLANVYEAHVEECDFFWTPFTDECLEGTFVNEVTKQNLR